MTKLTEAIEAARSMTQEERDTFFGRRKDVREYLTKESIDAYHDIIVEECARVCDNHWGGTLFADAIRALKVKP